MLTLHDTQVDLTSSRDMSGHGHYHHLPFWIHYERCWKCHLYRLHNHHYLNIELAILVFIILTIQRKFLKFE